MIITNPIIYRGKSVSFEELKNHSVIPLEVECDNCGNRFTTTKYQIVRNGHQFCQKCALHFKLSKPINIGDRYNRLTVTSIISNKECECECECGSIKAYKINNIRLGHTKSCGCLQKEKAKENISHAHFQKENHQNWKGGVCTNRQIFDGSPRKKFRNSVLERDGYTCVKCGNNDNLVAHHIISFSNDETLANSIDNGATLCEKCHRELHHIYGLKTSALDFANFLNNSKPYCSD